MTKAATVPWMIAFVLCLAAGHGAAAQSPYDRSDLSNVRVDCLRFVRIEVASRHIVGADCGSERLLAIPLAEEVMVFGLSQRLMDLRTGDEVMVRSTDDDAGLAIASSLDVNVTAFDVLVTHVTANGFALTMLDYHTGLPLRAATYTGNRRIANSAVVLPTAHIDSEHRLSSRPGRLSDVIVGDRAKLYGFQSPTSNVIYVFRMEDRGRG